MNDLGVSQIVSLAPAAIEKPKGGDPAKIHDAAEQFEALLLGQILRSERESNGGWLGSGGATSGSGDSATEFAEQHLAMALAKGGGLGLADLIASGLQQPVSKPQP
ncbi:MAG TPA: hypothetical protein VE959_38585 [Bryobacteraceae bacterium]|nr:hypothetical protein [Bryobacteraceae bacterium]